LAPLSAPRCRWRAARLQGLLLNPLADPYLIGVSAGAAFGATLAISHRYR